MAKLGNIEKVNLIKLPITISEVLDDYVLVKCGLEFESVIEPMLRGMIYRIKTYVLAEEIDNRKKDVKFTYTIPASWWHHFKKSHFPKWLLKRFPVKYIEYYKTKTVTFRKYATYPRANILFPDRVGELIKYRSFNEVESDIEL